MPFDHDFLESELAVLPPARKFWVGFSGGADSTALLHAMLALRERLDTPVRAIHVNHGLHADANAWEEHCRDWCERHGAALQVLRVSVSRSSGRGIEAEARRQRYRAIAERLQGGDQFLTAHHREDQAETLLLNLMRASGVDGLAGMPRTRTLGAGLLVRPLLEVDRDALRAYLEEHRLDFLEDPSNRDPVHDRNFMRLTVLPILEQRWPSAASRIARSARYCGQAATALERLAERTLEPLLKHERLLELPTGDNADTLDLALLLRHWLRRNGLDTPPAARLDEFCRQLAQAQPGNHIALAWHDGLVREHDGHLWLDSARSATPPPGVTWSGDRPLALGAASGIMTFSAPPRLSQPELQVTFRCGGERIRISDRTPRKSVKSVLREAGLPPWQREIVPLVFAGDRLLAVADLCLDNAFRRELENQSVQLSWTPGDALLAYTRQRALERAVDPPGTLG
ncbi:MAG: tRNA lysidine(34) synthetase TilS [Xanthomonadales bacterium]|nr:tRNA lysidine(34) synthetase TilS [Xanthomonadales bacterium]